jgi:hypothetical protein
MIFSTTGFSILSKHGKTASLSGLALLMEIIAEFRPLISTVIPEIVELLTDGADAASEVRIACADALLKLLEQGETAIAECRLLIEPAIPKIVNLQKEAGIERFCRNS